MAGAAGRQSLAVVAAEYEGSLFLSWNDGNAFRRFQQFLRNALSGVLMISWKTWVAF